MHKKDLLLTLILIGLGITKTPIQIKSTSYVEAIDTFSTNLLTILRSNPQQETEFDEENTINNPIQNSRSGKSVFEDSYTDSGIQRTLLKSVTFKQSSQQTLANIAQIFTQPKEDILVIGTNHKASFSEITTPNRGWLIKRPANTLLSFERFNQIVFKDNLSPSLRATRNSGIITSQGKILFKNNRTLSFEGNRSSDSGSVMLAKDFEATLNTKKISFDNNSCKQDYPGLDYDVCSGGALYIGVANLGSTVFDQNSADISFTSNHADHNGGAIASVGELIQFSRNTGEILFKNNIAEFGGAIHTETTTTFIDNNIVKFEENTTTAANSLGKGGAIYAVYPTDDAADPQILSFINNQLVSFNANLSDGFGGAIYAKRLLISDNISTSFKNNLSYTSGGAVYIVDEGELSLNASKGNIIFSNNRTSDPAGTESAPFIRNAIHLGGESIISQLSAKENHAIFFFDPITSDDKTTTTLLTINPESEDLGSIIFSGENLSEKESLKSANYANYLPHNVVLSHGTLSLKNGSVLTVESFNQEATSILRADIGTTLQTSTTSNGDINIANLQINGESITGTINPSTRSVRTFSRSQPTTFNIITNGTGNIALEGELNIVDESGYFYESHVLDNSSILNVVSIIPTGGGTVDTSNFTVSLPNQQPSSGYTGEWNLEWVNDPLDPTAGSTLQATWSKTSYTPGTFRKTSLVPNTLWVSAANLRTFSVLSLSSTKGRQFPRCLWISSMTSFINQEKSSVAHGFRHISGGYSIGTTTENFKGNILGLSFGHLFGKTKDRMFSHNKEKMFLGSIFAKFPYIDRLAYRPTLEVIAGYEYTDNKMKSTYTNLEPGLGLWHNNALLLKAILSKPLLAKNNTYITYLTPFIEAEGIYAANQGFKETGIEGRNFCKTHLTNISIPIGFTFDLSPRISKTTSCHLSTAYVPDVFRENPNNSVHLCANHAEWVVTGVKQGRNALRVKAQSNMTLNQNLEIFGLCNFETRCNSCYFNFDIGSRLNF